MSHSVDRHEDDIMKQLRELQQWKQDVGSKAVLSAEQYKKALVETESQSEQFKNELIQTQTETRQYQQQIETLKQQKEDLVQQLKLLKEDINMENTKKYESDKLSQEAILIKDEQIERLTLQLETFDIKQQTLETQLSSKNEQCNAQQMEINEFNQEISKLKIDKNDILLQLNEYKQTDKDVKMDKEMLIKKLKSQENDFINMKIQNTKLNQQLKQMQSTLDSLQKQNQVLTTDNDKYKQLLTKLRETENNIRQQCNEKDTQLHQLENKFNELNEQYQHQCNETADAEMLAAQYNNQIEEMNQVSEASSSRGGHIKAQRTQRLLLPQKTMNRLNVSKQASLKVPMISSHFRSSTKKILTSTMSSVFDIRDPSGQTLFAALQNDDENDDDYYGDNTRDRTDSICTDASFEFDMKVDEKGHKSRKSSTSMHDMIDGQLEDLKEFENENNLDDITEIKNRKSVPYDEENKSNQDAKFDMKLFQMRLQEEIKKEMEELEKQMQREYNVEFEEKKEELIGAHEESVLWMTNQHEKLSNVLEDLKGKYNAVLKEREPIELSMLEKFLSHILSI
eukprot:126949_1